MNNITRRMRSRVGFVVAAGLLLLGSPAQSAQPAPSQVAPPAPPAAPPSVKPPQPEVNFAPSPEVYAKLKTAAGRSEFVQTFCVGCHSTKLKTGGLVLEGLPTGPLSDNADVWEKVITRLTAGEMPPAPIKKRPAPEVAHAMVASLITDLDNASR